MLWGYFGLDFVLTSIMVYTGVVCFACWKYYEINYNVVILFTASRIRYEITSGNIGGAFAVKNMTGAIYVAGALDYETRKRVSEFVLAKSA